ncbi:MAG: 50S ribosomal protein L11 methyltransferase, partial [Actinomycetota bacterium]|nr:50S ribosomal protein L11 methyltransferase [Actinomycetota bacterium]
LTECARHLAATEVSPATLVCSGMLETETEGVAAELGACGLRPVDRRVEGEWASLLLRAGQG